MDKLLARLERRFGKFATEHLIAYLVAGMAIMFILTWWRPEAEARLVLDMAKVRQGEAWRLVTYLFLPPSKSLLWIIFALSATYTIGQSLESEWGAFKLNVYYVLGMVGTTAAAALTDGGMGNVYLNLSLFFAFATLFPDYQFTLYLLFPIRVKWLGLLSAALTGYRFIAGDWSERGAILAAFANYLLFFYEHLWALLRSRNLRVRQAAKRASFSPPPMEAGPRGRTCAICGLREVEDEADIRVCSCEKCQPPRTLCLQHARNH
jgi:hypothetical protein